MIPKQGKEFEEESPVRNPYKVRSFQKAISVVEGLDKPIQKAKDVEALKGLGIGSGIQKRISDLLNGNYTPGKVDPVERKNEQKKLLIRLELEKVPYIGPTAAEQLVSKGCESIKDLLKPKYFKELKPTQRIGAKYYQHLQQPVIREEAEAIAELVKETMPADGNVIICGSYRRNFPIASSVVLLIQHPSHVHIPLPSVPPFEKVPEDANPSRFGRTHADFRPKGGYSTRHERSRDPLSSKIVPALEERGLLAEKLQCTAGRWVGIARVPEASDAEAYGGIANINPYNLRRMRKEGVSKVEGRFRKVELALVPEKSLGAALIALTGDVEFNRIIRLQAAKMGLLLNEYGLWKWNEGTWELLTASGNEKEIFAELGMSYVEPEKRNYSYLTKSASRTRPATDLKPALKAY
ncbi:dna polymerase beta [Moniliophthora roreri MCA 2997]|uniref:DNA polymerase n=2 Tax=Moniliophthora roreri TaxID=221103 RepID=V2YU61_MONRO|nr:dna polymerase beta [Moniliophthora roreri MCA 2997]